MPRFQGQPVDGPRFQGQPVEQPAQLSKRVAGGPLTQALGFNPGVGILETASQMASGLLTGPLSGFAGLKTLLAGGTGQEAAESVNRVSGLGFQPRTESGRIVSEAVSKPFQAISRFADTAGEVSGDPSDVLGATAVRTAIEGAPALLGLKSLRSKPLTLKQQVARNAQDRLGLVADPASTGISSAATTAQGLGGKVAVRRALSQRNQVRVNATAARELGLPDQTPITPSTLDAVRTNAGAAFENLRTQGTVATDTAFRRAIAQSSRSIKEVSKSFDELGKGGKRVTKIADDLAKQQSFDFNAGVSAVQELRDLASSAFRKGKSGQGRAYRNMSKAIEEVMDRELLRRGAGELVSDMRSARELIAKSYTIEQALVGSDVSAVALGNQLKRGKPLTGDLRAIAEFAQEFPQVSKVIKATDPQFSALDFLIGGTGGALGAVATGEVSAALPAAGVLAARPVLRGLAQQSRVPSALTPAAPGSSSVLLTELIRRSQEASQ